MRQRAISASRRISATNSITHKIDPNVDEERDFVRASLVEGGGVISDTYFLPKDPVQGGKTATGGSFHSDGRVLILQLGAATPALIQRTLCPPAQGGDKKKNITRDDAVDGEEGGVQALKSSCETERPS